MLTVLLTAVLANWLTPTAVQARERITLDLTQIPLPGAPVSIQPVDLNEDGITDLAIVIAYTTWDQLTIEESVEMDEIEGLVEMMTVVPALADRRELHVFLGQPDGDFEALEPLPLDLSVITIGLGPPREPLFALTDEGLAGLRLDESGRTVELVATVPVRSILSGTRALLPDLELTADVTGDGIPDLLVPQDHALAIYSGSTLGTTDRPTSSVQLPEPRFQHRNHRTRRYPLPSVADVDGDGIFDLLFRFSAASWRTFWVARGLGGGRFETLTAPLGVPGATTEDEYAVSFGPPELPTLELAPQWREPVFPDDSDDDETLPPRISWFGDLDGQGRAEYVLVHDLSESGGFRKEMKQAKRPPVRFEIRTSRTDLAVAAESVADFEGIGYALDTDDEAPLPGGFQDLDGDGRQDLVTLTLDFTIFQAVRVMATKRLNIGIDFHIWCQQSDGSFTAVTGLDLSGRLKLRLNDLRIGQMSQFAGDFDGDGRADFVQMGRGRKVTIHRGQDGCRYPEKPDLLIKLDEAPRDLSLVKVTDFDGDGRSDLAVVQPADRVRDGASTPVRLDLYLSRGGESP